MVHKITVMYQKMIIPKTILCKVTSRGRPDELIYCISKHIELSENPTALKWLISLDFDDEKSNSKDLIDKIHELTNYGKIVFSKSNSKIHAINRDVNDYEHEWQILLNISDDQIPEVKGWDSIIRDSMPNDLDRSLWFYDGWQRRINTQEILGYNYYKRDNYIYHPDFKSFFCDNLSTRIAQKRGKLLKFNHCIIRHFHPGWTKQTHMKDDETYNKCKPDWKHDEDLYNKLKNEL
jgi:hypothetical protein